MRQAARVSSARTKQALRPGGNSTTRKARTQRHASSDPSADDGASTIKSEPSSPSPKKASTTATKRKREPTSPRIKKSPKKIKTEEADDLVLPETLPPLLLDAATGTKDKKPLASSTALQSKKLKAYTSTAGRSPFPNYAHPTAAEAILAHQILTRLHGARVRPEEIKAQSDRAGCGDSPSVLDALVRTILSQNTSDTNSARAKRSMDAAYGRSDNWEGIVDGGRERLQEVIKCGGLSAVKSRVILNILEEVRGRYGEFSLEALREKSDGEAMAEMIGFQGVGPKTASCVLLFCLGRESFAVDTHVWRISKLLGWVPQGASRDETHAHLDVRIPDQEKYGLHILMVGHGKKCEECKAGGRNGGSCELRRAFRKGKVEGVKKEETEELEDEIKGNGDDEIKDEDPQERKPKKRGGKQRR